MFDTTTVILFLICFFGSFLFSGSEAGFVSWSPLKVGHRAGLGDMSAKWGLFLMNHKDKVISAILIGNNICNIGATLLFVKLYLSFDQSFPLDLSAIPSPESWFLTPIMVMFGEILPKSLFRTYPFRLTLRVMPFLITVYFITLPFTWLFSKFTNLFNVVPKEEEQTFKTRAREEMVLIAVEGSKRGTLFESADIFIENILKLKDRKIADMMQPISEIMENPIFTVRQTVGDLKKDLPDSDECIIFDVPGKNPQGYVTVSEIALVDPRRRLREFTKPLKSIEMGISLLAALKQLRDIQQKFLIVTDGPRIVGILDKMDVLKETYGGISSVLGSDAV